ncbi:MAG: 5-(hydroxymethyl)furfural/furfural oxidase [Solirubrobacterales bacterium]|nr:5-(hydroxymethyl)furfural/furfural oxidase [Solirubrobacterales bacterium]
MTGAELEHPQKVDFLIVGSGPAGCVLARRLSDAGAAVTLVEAGPDLPLEATPDDIRDTYPRSYFNDAYTWKGLEVDQGADGSGQRTPFRQGRILGGGGSLMGMIALRGLPGDYDDWGIPGWGWEDLLPHFRGLEDDWDFDGPNHGRGGPIPIRRHMVADLPPFLRAIGTAAGNRDWPLIDDMNTDFADGFGRLPMSSTVTERVSALTGYLPAEVRKRDNLTVLTDTTAERLLFDGGRCVGVSVGAGARPTSLRGDRVILCAGAIQSPALLQRSGIGPAPHLRSLGIPVVADLAGVGENLQNHPVSYLATYLAKEARQSPRVRPQFLSALRFSSAVGSTSGDMNLLPVNKSSWHGLGAAVAGIGVCLMRPDSRGSVRITSTSSSSFPDVRFRTLSDPRDFARMVGGMQVALELMQDPAVLPLRRELFAAGYSRVVRRLNEPGRVNAQVTRLLAATLDGPDALRHAIIKWGIAGGQVDEARMRNRSWMEATVRKRAFGTYHPAGTCRMGSAEDPAAVVDADCSVLGTEGLSVVDASIMPTIVRANTHIPVVGMAERAAEILVARAP